MNPETLANFLFILALTLNVILLNRVITYGVNIRLKNRWSKVNMAGMQAVMDEFADIPCDMKTTILKYYDPWNITCGYYDSSEQYIWLNTVYLRSHKSIVNTLLHEICHRNQHTQGRLDLGLNKSYYFRPIEREARAFARIWQKEALRIYKNAR